MCLGWYSRGPTLKHGTHSFIHSFVHQRFTELLFARLRGYKSERHSPSLAQLSLRRAAHRSSHVIFTLVTTDTEGAETPGKGTLGGACERGAVCQSLLSLLFHATYYTDTPVFSNQRPKLICNENLTPAGSGRTAKVNTFYCLGTQFNQKV